MNPAFPATSLAVLLATAALLCAAPAMAQTAAQTAQPPAAQERPSPAAPVKSRKRRHVDAQVVAPCQAVKDPWETVCKIRQNAAVACSDLPAPAKPPRKPRKGQAVAPAAPAAPDIRQQCIDAYMRNV
jgi:hypothetical protein